MKRLLCLLLCALLCLGCLAGCAPKEGKEDDTSKSTDVQIPETEAAGTETADPEETSGPVQTAVDLSDPKNLGFTDFDNKLIEYLKQAGRAGENFTVSPLSYKAALALAAIGAEGETQAQLLSAMGFRDRAELDAWYQSVLDGVDRFDAYFEQGNFDDRGDAAYQVVNSIWKNEDLPGAFREAYVKDALDHYRAEAFSAPALKLANAVNAWVNEKTKGLIPQLLNDASESSAVLVNALYLKAGWEHSFDQMGADDFTTAAGQIVQKEYMRAVGSYRYYADDSCRLVGVPLQGGMTMLFVLGDDSDLAAKLAKAQYARLELQVPKFDVETTLDQRELCDYLLTQDCGRLFTDAAEFAPMFTEPLRVDDIIQKAKVHIDEEGLEAAAATAMMMVATAAFDPEKPELFRLDQAFSFYIVNGGETPELLFWGQIVE